METNCLPSHVNSNPQTTRPTRRALLERWHWLEDWADALIRVAEAGIDTEEILEYLRSSISPEGMVDKRWADRLIGLEEAGVDVEEVLSHGGPFTDAYSARRSRHASGRHARHHRVYSVISSGGELKARAMPGVARERELEIRGPAAPAEPDEQALAETWKREIRVNSHLRRPQTSWSEGYQEKATIPGQAVRQPEDIAMRNRGAVALQ